jgi:quercetin dioxygenase-like cupin family protein
MRSTILSLALSFALAGSALGQAQAIAWGPAPAVFPPGAKMAVLQGDPSQASPFTVRLEMPDGYTIPPHFHPTDENVTVIEGTFLVGMGDKADFSKPLTLAAGGFITAPANHHHFARAKGKTVVQVTAIGPFALTYVNAGDDPQKKLGNR